MFSADVLALLALCIWRPRNVRLEFRRGIPIVLGSALILATGFIAVALWFGSTASAWVHISGEPILIEPSTIKLGKGKAEEIRVVEIRLTNHTDHVVRVLNSSSDCACISVANLPLEISPKNEGVLTVRVQFTGSPGTFRKQLILFISDERTHVMPVIVLGRVTK